MNKIYNLLTLCLLFCCVGQANAQVSTSPPAGASAATVTNYFGPVTYVSTTNVVVAGSTMTKTAGGNPNWDGGGVAPKCMVRRLCRSTMRTNRNAHDVWFECRCFSR